MVNKLIEDIKEIDKPILKFIHKGLNFSAGICCLSLLVLIAHSTYPISHIGLKSSIILFKTGVMFASSFLICGFVTDKIKKQII